MLLIVVGGLYRSSVVTIITLYYSNFFVQWNILLVYDLKISRRQFSGIKKMYSSMCATKIKFKRSELTNIGC